MNDSDIWTLEQVRQFLDGTEAVQFHIEEALLHGASRGRPERFNIALCHAVTVGHPEMSHYVQDRARNRSLRLLRGHRATPHRSANDRFVSRHAVSTKLRLV